MAKLNVVGVKKLKGVLKPFRDNARDMKMLRLMDDIETALILADYDTGPDSSRSAVTGYDTYGTNSAFGNSGFSGGCTARVVPA